MRRFVQTSKWVFFNSWHTLRHEWITSKSKPTPKHTMTVRGTTQQDLRVPNDATRSLQTAVNKVPRYNLVVEMHTPVQCLDHFSHYLKAHDENLKNADV